MSNKVRLLFPVDANTRMETKEAGRGESQALKDAEVSAWKESVGEQVDGGNGGIL